MLKGLLATCAILLAPAFLLAQPLADRIPADAIVYLGWQGSQAMPSAYANSHLKGILDASHFELLATDFLPRLAQHLRDRNPRAGQIMETLAAACGPLWRHPSALYVASFDFKAPGVRPRFAILCEAGPEADLLLAQFKSLLQLFPQASFPLRAFKSGQLVVLTGGYDPDTQVLASPDSPTTPKSLATNPTFQHAIHQVQQDAILLAYIDAEAALAQANEAITKLKTPTAANWPKFLDALGLGSFKRIVVSGGFEGRDWSTQAFIAAPAPRQGLATLLESKPISDATLKLIPQAATSARVERLDLAGLFDVARNLAGQMDPLNQVTWDDGVTQVNQMFGFDLRQDVLEAFHNEWIFYTIPAGGTSADGDRLGLVLINRLNKPVEAERTLNQFEQFAGRLVAGLLKESGSTLNQKKVGPLIIHTVSAGPVAPSWTIANGNLAFTLSPQSLPAVVENTGKGASMLENPDFVALRKRLGGQNAISLDFADLSRTAPEIYPTLLQLSQQGLGWAKTAGIEPPPGILPPLNRLSEHLNAAASFSWIDDAGWHYRSISPFPGSTLLSPSGHAITVNATRLAILLLDWSSSSATP